jgi:hypothetical protein
VSHAAIAAVLALVALRAPNVRDVEIAPDADDIEKSPGTEDNRALPIPAAS